MMLGKEAPVALNEPHPVRGGSFMFHPAGSLPQFTPEENSEEALAIAEAVDHLVDKLLAERALPHERLEPGARPTWIERVKQVVLSHPKGQKRLI